MDGFVDLNEVANVLRGFNPWWSDIPQRVPPFHRLAHRVCLRHLGDDSLHRAILLRGPRRVGKTTILYQLVDWLLEEDYPPKSILYLSLDHPILKLLPLSDILRLYHETVYPQGQSAVLLLDEVQYSADWDLHLKQLVDRRPEYRIVATGSASVVQRQRMMESGVGRWIEVPVPTLSFYEFMHIRGADVSVIPSDLRPLDLFNKAEGELAVMGTRFRQLMPPFLDYLLLGGFPETARLQDVSLCQRLLREDVVERVLKRDMTALFGIRNVNELEKLFIYLCLHSGGIFAVRTCATALGTSATTVTSHLEALEQANLIYRLSPAGVGGKKVLRARYKFYLVDAALRNAVLLRGREILDDAEQMGIIVETTILRHLYAYHYRDTPEIVYWRDAKTEQEVDIIVKSPNYVIPVEVKYRGSPTFRARDGLATFCQTEPVAHAYWVTQREQDFGVARFPGLDTQFLKVPAHVFAYLLGQAERLLWAD